MKHYIVFLMFMSLNVMTLRAYDVKLQGMVMDAFTKTGVKAEVVLMDSNGMPLDTVQTKITRGNARYSFFVPARKATYLIKASSEGYKDSIILYQIKHIARNNQFDVPFIYLKKDFSSDVYKSVDLNGVVVKGTMVRMTYRGDTLVYHASAFKVLSGSMLDALVKQLPGAELKSNGDIYINGRKVDYLTLNGRDFFKGRNRVILDNLPYYTVKELKVYEKENERSEWLGYHSEKKDYVMDVSLKQQYVTGSMANFGSGYGTDEHYLSRAFGLRTTNHSQLSLYGNINNTNDNSTPDNSSDWNPSLMDDGKMIFKEIGSSLTINDKDRRWDESCSARMLVSKNTNQMRQLTHEYSSDADIISNKEASSVAKNIVLNISNKFKLIKPFKLFTNYNFTYAKNRSDGSDFQSSLRNTELYETESHNESLKTSASVDYMTMTPCGDNLSINVSGSFNRNKPDEEKKQDSIYYYQLDSVSKRATLSYKNMQSYDYKITGHYIMHFRNYVTMSGMASYQQMYENKKNLFCVNSDYDLFNSNRSNDLTRIYYASLNCSYMKEQNGKTLNFNLLLPIEYRAERLRYRSWQLDTLANRSGVTFLPSFYMNIHLMGYMVEGAYTVSVLRPDFTSLMPVMNNFVSLHGYINNPYLKNGIVHKLNFLMGHTNQETGTSLFWGLGYSSTHNAIGRRICYNRVDGNYTYKNDNVNGNRSVSSGINYHRDWGEHKALSTDIESNWDYTRNVDYEISYDVPTENLSIVNTLLSNSKVKIKYVRGSLTLGVNAHLLWRKSASDRASFTKINTYDYDYGMNISYIVPVLNIGISTDMKMFSMRGYSMSSMNSDNLVWNATLGYDIIKNKLACKLTGYDLLHQLSNKKTIFDAQGYTEIIRTSVPSYAMLTMTCLL